MKKNGLTILAGFVIIAIYIWTVVLGNDPLQPSIASKILRFHVLANSDTSCAVAFVINAPSKPNFSA